jgi:hypothetical protein
MNHDTLGGSRLLTDFQRDVVPTMRGNLPNPNKSK